MTPSDFVQAGLPPCKPCIQAKTYCASHTTEAVKTKVLQVSLDKLDYEKSDPR